MVNNKSGTLSVILALSKIRVTLPVTFLCFAGYSLYSGGSNTVMWLSCAGVFLLSSASSVWNQVMERKYDQLMSRTHLRPIPSGKISTNKANIIASVLFVTGALILLYISFFSFLLGLFAVVWYLFVYTLLKRKTAFATIPGALSGAIPLLIGWDSAGGFLFSPYILTLGGFIILWQIPHFWLLMIIYNEDYKKAGFPTLSQTLSNINLKLWTMAWIVVLIISALLLPLFLCITNSFLVKTIFIPGILVLIFSISTLSLKRRNEEGSLKLLFHVLNSFMVLIILLIILFR